MDFLPKTPATEAKARGLKSQSLLKCIFLKMTAHVDKVLEFSARPPLLVDNFTF